MTTFETLFEQDKERIRTMLDGADEETAVREVRRELDRLLAAFLAQEEDPFTQQAAGYLLRTAGSAAGLTDVQGEAQVYGRTLYSEEGTGKRAKKGSSAGGAKAGRLSPAVCVLAAAGLLCLLLVIWLVFSLETVQPAGKLQIVLFSLLGGVCFWAVGQSMEKSGGQGETKLYASTSVDGEKVCRRLREILLRVDRELEQMRQACKAQERLASGEEETDSPLWALLSDLLEAAYGLADEEEAGEMAAQIRFYLHRQGIEAVDLEQGQRAWFEFLPAPEAMTIRPALVRDGVLLKKGLAAHG